MISTIEEAQIAIEKSWAMIKSECLEVLGSELHYQAMIYHILRTYGDVPIEQLGMNVKMEVSHPTSELFKALAARKHKDFQGAFETIPDIVIFSPTIRKDWRRRNYENTLQNILIAIEVKASERANSRLTPSEIIQDIEKLSAHRQEVEALGKTMYPLMLIIDSAPIEKERMTQKALFLAEQAAADLRVGLLYISPSKEIFRL